MATYIAQDHSYCTSSDKLFTTSDVMEFVENIDAGQLTVWYEGGLGCFTIPIKHGELLHDFHNGLILEISQAQNGQVQWFISHGAKLVAYDYADTIAAAYQTACAWYRAASCTLLSLVTD